MSRIEATFARLRAAGRTALMPYLMTGYPEHDSALELAPALETAGADLFELGVPFSDPLADGATIQRASERALANGIRLEHCIETVAELRKRGVHAPIVPMGYYNPFLQYGLERLARDMADAGADGLIIPDLPPEEAHECHAACRAHDLDMIFFVAPTTPDERIERIAALASGFHLLCCTDRRHRRAGANCGADYPRSSNGFAAAPVYRWWSDSASAARRMSVRRADMPPVQSSPAR
jgi:tryptophan synthase alpha chain